MTRSMRLLLVVTLLLVAPRLYGYGVIVTEIGRVVRWSTPDLTYYLGTYVPSSLGQAGLNAVDAGFTPWTTANCSVLAFSKVGTTAVTTVMPTGANPDGKNEVIYAKSAATWPHGYGVLGVTVPLYSTDGRIIEADIAFSPQVSWTTSSNPGYGDMNIQGVATHEIGHFFGLQHVLDYYGYGGSDMPTMVPATEDGVSEMSLSDDDLLGTCFLYPNGEYSCANASQCPDIIDTYQSGDEYIKGSFSCTQGACKSALVKEGTKGYGEECPDPADCKSPYFCQPLSSGQKCTQECNPNAPNCPNGNGCIPYQDMADVGVCLPSSNYELSHTCANGYECDSALCYPNPDSTDRYCRESCKVSLGNCPTDFTCLSYTGIDYGGCIPDDLIGPAPKQVGESCTAHAECASGVCGDGTCRKACTSDATCGAGQVCQFFAGKKGCATGQVDPTGAADGESCAADGECKSGLCAMLPGTTFAYCRSACLPGGTCPTGTTCVLYDDPAAGVCMPTAHTLGDYCSNNNDCTTKICHSTAQGTLQCVEACRSSGAACPSGSACADDSAFGPVCLPDASGSGGDTPAGGACEQDGDCQTGLCHEGVCTLRCNVFDSGCPNGFGCLGLGDGNAGGCIPVGGAALGDACDGDADCASALCASLGDGGQCVKPCDRTDPDCASGQDCVGMGGYAVLGVCYGGDGGGPGDRDGAATSMCAWSSIGADPWALSALGALMVLALKRRRTRRA